VSKTQKANPKPYHQPQQVQNQFVAAVQHKTFSGPVPAPEELERYEAIQQGFAERFLRMAEVEQQSRLNRTDKQLDAEIYLAKQEIRLKKRGQWFALVATGVISGLSGYAFYLGFDNAATGIACTIIVGLAGLFLVNKYIEKADKEKPSNQ
jgi:uncharacterized membrane protein